MEKISDKSELLEISFFQELLPELCVMLDAIKPGLSEKITSEYSDQEILIAFERSLIANRSKIIQIGSTDNFKVSDERGKFGVSINIAKSFNRFVNNAQVKAVSTTYSLA
jgi:hypothetical protein